MTARLYTAQDVARFCDVDIKTIHNWANRGRIAHHRTEGRHLRFRRADLVEFLRRFNYPVPDALRAERGRVVLIDADTTSSAAARRVLSRRFEVFAYADAFEALLGMSAIDPDAVVLDDLPFMEASRAVERLRAAPATRGLRLVVFSARTDRRDAALKAGADEFVAKTDPARLKEALDPLLGA
jgi:excisionase family DNA binding protein